MGGFICNRCNSFRNSDDGCATDIFGKNELICDDCLSNGANDCEECGEEIEYGQEFLVRDDKLYHKTCIKGEDDAKILH